jgi:hypothetical protein
MLETSTTLETSTSIVDVVDPPASLEDSTPGETHVLLLTHSGFLQDLKRHQIYNTLSNIKVFPKLKKVHLKSTAQYCTCKLSQSCYAKRMQGMMQML